jgi:hypothetical protein
MLIDGSILEKIPLTSAITDIWRSKLNPFINGLGLRCLNE